MLQVRAYRILVLRFGEKLIAAPNRIDLECKILLQQPLVNLLNGLQHITHQYLLHAKRLLEASLDFLNTDWGLGTENQCLNMVLKNIQGVKILVVTLQFCFDRVLRVWYSTQSFLRYKLAGYDAYTVSSVLNTDQSIL